jgi:hypothetical protein
MVRPSLPVAGPKRRAAPPILPLGGALSAMPFAPLSPQPLTAALVAQDKKPLRPPRLKLKAPGGKNGRSV